MAASSAEKFNPEKYTPAGRRLLEEYQAQGQPFDVSTRPYYSSGSISMRLVDYAAGPPAVQFAIADAGTVLPLFSYSRGSAMGQVGFPNTRVANPSDTNMSVNSETNNEDFVIEGISCYSRGIRAASPAGTITDSVVLQAVQFSNNTYTDISSVIQPPEVSSPLALEDALWEACKNKLSLSTLWDLKQTDFLGMLNEVPEGGAKSYLRTSGTPLATNYMAIPEGFIWRNTASKNDKLFQLLVKIEMPIIMLVTNAPLVAGNKPTAIAVDFGVRLHGTAFYYPSTN